MINKFYMIVCAFVIILIDQCSKTYIAKTFILGQKVELINNFISFIFVRNTGAAFNLFAGQTQLLSIFSAIVAISIIVYFMKKKASLPWYEIIGWGLILGGTIGNFIDRVMLGYVIDFIKVDVINSPVFNIADMSINAGAIIILVKAIINITEEKSDKVKNQL